MNCLLHTQTQTSKCVWKYNAEIVIKNVFKCRVWCFLISVSDRKMCCLEMPIRDSLTSAALCQSNPRQCQCRRYISVTGYSKCLTLNEEWRVCKHQKLTDSVHEDITKSVLLRVSWSWNVWQNQYILIWSKSSFVVFFFSLKPPSCCSPQQAALASLRFLLKWHISHLDHTRSQSSQRELLSNCLLSLKLPVFFHFSQLNDKLSK